MTVCSKCGADNRPKAKFCRKCGARLAETVSREGFFGKDNIGADLGKFQARLKLASHIAATGKGSGIGLDTLVLGPQGCGKKFVVSELVNLMTEAGTVDASKVTEIDAADYLNWSNSLDSSLQKLAGGVLIITNVHKLLSGADSSAMTNLDPLFSRMSKGFSEMPVIMMTGLLNDMEGFLSANPNIADLFECVFRLKDMDEDSLTGLTAAILNERFSLGITAEAREKLKGHYQWLVRIGEGTSGNGYLAFKKAEELATNLFSRNSSGTVMPEDITGKVFIPRSEEEIWSDLDKFVGLESVKGEMRNIVNSLREAREEKSEAAIRDHYLFTGNPGTGKTTIARKFAEILAAIGALPKGQFIETDPSELIGRYVGDTEKNVRDAVDRAMGGILFIDEAYGLANGQFGQAAINTLVPLLENRRGEFVCIAAGYRTEMGDFMKKNTGLKSRFNKTVEFPDYTPSELQRIFLINASNAGYSLTAQAEEKLHVPMQRMYDRRTDHFGNGRDVRNFFEQSVERRNRRLEGIDIRQRRLEGKVLTYADIVGEEETKEIDVNEVLSQLDALVGLDEVKREIRLLAATIIQEKKKAERKGTSPVIPVNHCMFLGNPGTGKTTVARMMGRILKSLGVLSTDEVVEVGRYDLVAQYQGQTAPKTKDAVMRAMGGILFIDEAYSLNNGENDSFGHECIDALVPLILNNKNKFVCIAAGYTGKMQEFMAANPGLASRFPKKIVFRDYGPDQLMEIFRRTAASNGFRLDPEAESRAAGIFTEMYEYRDENFGNAREVANFFDNVRNFHNLRLMSAETTEEQECTITADDVDEAYKETIKQ